MGPGQLLICMGLPSAVTAFCFWLIEHKIARRGKKEDEREAAREKNEILLLKLTAASIALSEATARAVQRIPDAHCNGDMHDALEYAKTVKHEQKDFLSEQGIHALYD